MDVDWLDGPREAPLVALFHGLEGSSRSHYAHAVMQALTKRRWRGAFPHFRSCGGELNRLPRAYHSGDAAEIGWMLSQLREPAAGAPLFAAGFSLGGNALLKWLGEAGVAARPLVQAAAAISAPLDLAKGAEAIERGLSLMYTHMFLRTLKRKAWLKSRLHPGLFDAVKMRQARTLREFDDAYTAPLHGFADAADYYRRASAKTALAAIRIPTLIINARNDPFLPGHHLPEASEVSPQVTFETPAHGGHVGFVSGAFPGHLRWLPERIMAFFSQHLSA